VHTTKDGLEGHAFNEAQGPWFASQLALYADAAKASPEWQPLAAANGRLTLQEGRLAFDLQKSRVTSHGWLQMGDAAAVVQDAMHQSAPKLEGDLQAVRLQYDAAKWRGKILTDRFLQGKSADGMRQAILAEFGKDVKVAAEKSVEP